ncbi:putative glycosyltransferase [Thermoplasmatales archaeon SCGC AB-539-N05]|nr:putative glycosyltransferase [Thermoplasmatales archaeon SCGC AB-539-N05]
MEILVVDGANSKENKIEVEKFKDKRVKYVPVEPEAVNYISWTGVQHARNIGCKTAKGKYIAMLDDDDIWLPEKTEEQLKVFEKEDDELALVICYNKIISGYKEVIDRPKENPVFEDLLKSFNLSSTSTFLMRRDVLEEVGWWNENLRGMHEYDIALKMTKEGYKIKTVKKPLMIRHRIANEARSYYYIKIAEVIDLWHYFGKDFIPHIGLNGFLFNSFKTIGLFCVFLMGYLIKEKVWDIIYPLKTLYERRGLS